MFSGFHAFTAKIVNRVWNFWSGHKEGRENLFDFPHAPFQAYHTCKLVVIKDYESAFDAVTLN